jgi:DNA-binding response OmpR family regulator
VASLLVVDDEPAIRLALERYFAHRGYHVDCASNVAEAMELLACERYDVAILDLRLSGSHGREGIGLLVYAREASPRTRSIVLTACGSPEDEDSARTLGAHYVLRKPLALPSLAEAVRSLACPGPGDAPPS